MTTSANVNVQTSTGLMALQHLDPLASGSMGLLTPPQTDDTPNSGSDSPSTARLTPQSDSEDDDAPIGMAHDGDRHEAYELERFSEERDPDDTVRSRKTSATSSHQRQRLIRDRSVDTAQSYMLYTPDEERAVIRKFDRRVVLLLAILYMMSFLDRSNIGNARIAGLEKDLRLSFSQFETLVSSFYITYILFEWMTLLYGVVPPHIYISVCVLSWGLLASFQSIATSYLALLLLRALLGISEAAFGPGVPFYLSFFYRREELALRTGLFISAAPLATSFASSLAWVITKLGRKGPIAPWRLLFLVEGFPSIFVAVYAWISIPDRPGEAKFLTRREKKVAKLRLRREREPKTKSSGLNWRELWQTLGDPKCYLTAAMFFSCNVAFSSLPVFLPTIINEMGHSALTSQALSAPPFLLAFIIVIITALLSDRFQDRSLFICFHALLGASGYCLIAVAGLLGWPTIWRYIGVYPAAAGFFSAITIIITWTINNQESDSRKGMGVTMLNVIGQCGPLLGTHLYPDSDKPLYVKGMAVCSGLMLLVFFLSLSLRLILSRQNRRKGVLYSAVQDDVDDEYPSKHAGQGGLEEFRFML